MIATYSLSHYWLSDGDRRVLLIDTPGFDNSHCSDTEIFQEMVFFLVQAYIAGARLGGILYLHRITHNRVTGFGAHAFNLIKKICGPSAASSVALVTTWWDQLGQGGEQYGQGIQREKELLETESFWGSMQQSGSRTMRWHGTSASARSVVASLLQVTDGRSPILQIQREIVDDGKELDDTEAGLEMARHHGMMWQQLCGELKSITAELQEARLKGDEGMTRILSSHREEIQNSVESVEKSQRHLHDDFESLYTERAAMYQKLYEDAKREEVELRREVERLSQREQQVTVTRPQEHRLSSNKLSKSALRLDNRQGSGVTASPPFNVVLERLKKRQVLKRNMIPILGMLGGVAVMAAGGATLMIPIVAAGVALFGTAAMKVDVSRSAEKKKKRDDEWDVQEHTD